MGDVFKKKGFLLGKNVFSGEVGSSNSRSFHYDYDAGKYFINYRNSAFASLNIRFVEEFSLYTTFLYHFNKKAVMPWTADYFYSLKRYNWRPNTFSYGYENYADNQYDDKLDELYQKFLRGYFFVSYNHRLPKKWIDKVRLSKYTDFSLTYFMRYSARYKDEMGVTHGSILKGKPVIGATARYTIWEFLYVEAAAYYYPVQQSKLPWDPDFTYGFGWSDWRPFKLSITYGNWVVNRFPWNTNEMPYYNFTDGDLRISFNYKW